MKPEQKPSGPRRTWLVGVIGLLAVAGIGWSAMRRRTSSPPARLQTGLPTLLDFGMDTCAQCKKTRAMLERIAPAYAERLRVQFVDIRDDANDGLTSKFAVRVIPLLVLLDAAGQELWRHEGLPEEGVLRARLDDVAG
jgi:thiol-disulfide isomerase/thioredoxin